MTNNIEFIELTPAQYQTYIDIGTTAYNQHYKHLWPNGDTSTYIQHSFTKKVLLKEEQDQNTILYLIQLDLTYVGLLKVTLHKQIEDYSKEDAIFLDKIYILKEYSGKGIGRKSLQFIDGIAKELNKKVLFLESMQKSLALHFYMANNFKIVANTIVSFNNVIENEKKMYILKKTL